jgi:hypothetical protein
MVENAGAWWIGTMRDGVWRAPLCRRRLSRVLIATNRGGDEAPPTTAPLAFSAIAFDAPTIPMKHRCQFSLIPIIVVLACTVLPAVSASASAIVISGWLTNVVATTRTDTRNWSRREHQFRGAPSAVVRNDVRWWAAGHRGGGWAGGAS